MTRERWPGGYVHKEADGRSLFIIEKMVRGQRFHLSTRAHSLRAAMAQLERFEADPNAYAPEGDQPEAPLVMTDELVQKFYRWQVGKGTSHRHARETVHLLSMWLVDFKGKDLRRVTLRDDINPALDERKTRRQHRIISLKVFYSWLRRKEGLLVTAQDPTLDLAVPQAVPEKHRRRKAVPWATVAACFAHLSPAYRDVLQVMAATGWHFSELERFARGGDSRLEVLPEGSTTPKGQPLLAVAVVRHKTGGLARTPIVEAAHLEAARRIRERGELPRKVNDALASACGAAKVEKFTIGMMRHSVATWAIEQGASPQTTAEYLNHADKRTTLRFYADHSVPTVAIPVRVLG